LIWCRTRVAPASTHKSQVEARIESYPIVGKNRPFWSNIHIPEVELVLEHADRLMAVVGADGNEHVLGYYLGKTTFEFELRAMKGHFCVNSAANSRVARCRLIKEEFQ